MAWVRGDYRGPDWLEVTINGTAQGTTYHIIYFASDSVVKKGQIDSVLDRLDSSLSLYKPYSLINAFNQSESGIHADDHFLNVFRKSRAIFRETRGLFDITVEPLVQLWGFGTRKTVRDPDEKAVRDARQCVGSRLLTGQEYFAGKKKPCVRIDMNGIAQGYSVDMLAGLLEWRGVANYIVELGGEIRVKGRKHPSGEKFRVGIESSVTDEWDDHPTEQLIYMDHGAVTTSGNYRQFHESNGKRVTHIINPHTGYPVDNEMISVTVFAPDAMTADGYDNALMLMGVKKSLAFAENHPELAVFIIYKKPDGTIGDTASRRFYEFLNP